MAQASGHISRAHRNPTMAFLLGFHTSLWKAIFYILAQLVLPCSTNSLPASSTGALGSVGLSMIPDKA
ncbi:UNVERIFIED_CONTAM: hypothetical protein K2H54_033367 [Gekko kuhli]